MSFDIAIGLTFLRVVIIGYLAYRLLSKINWPLFFYYLRGGNEYDY